MSDVVLASLPQVHVIEHEGDLHMPPDKLYLLDQSLQRSSAVYALVEQHDVLLFNGKFKFIYNSESFMVCNLLDRRVIR